MSAPVMRVTYNHGRLEIVTTSAGHEAWKGFVLRLVHVLSEELEIDLESRGGGGGPPRKESKT